MNRPRIGKGAATPFLLAVVATLAVLLLSFHGSPNRAEAGASMIGIDVDPQTNTPASLGNLETCATHQVGDEFPVDIFVNNVSNLRSWELRIDYDETILQLVSVDHGRFLLSTPPGGNVFPALSEVEAPGRQFLAAAEVSGPADSGSGALARITLKALAKGVSDLRIVNSPSYLGPQLTGTQGSTIGDTNGDRIWDDTITSGRVAVGQDCTDDPIVTPKPSPKPTPTLPPGATARPTPTPGPSLGPTGEPGVTPNPSDIVLNPIIPIDSPGPDDDNDPSVDDPGTDGEDPGDDGSSEGGDDPNDPGDDDDNNGRGSISDATGGDDSGSSAGVMIIIGLVAAALVAGGGVLYMFSRRTAI